MFIFMFIVMFIFMLIFMLIFMFMYFHINPIPRGISELRKRAGGGGFRPPTMISSPEHILQAITLFISFLDSPIKYLAGHIHFFVIAWKMLWQWPIFERHFFSKMSEKSQICEISVRKTIDSRPKKLPCYKMTCDKKMKVPLLCIWHINMNLQSDLGDICSSHQP